MTSPSKSIKTLVMIGVMGGVFLTAFLGSALNIALPDIEAEFKVSASLIGWVATAYLMTNAAFLLLAGWLGDRFGRMKVFLSGLATTTTTTALIFFSPSIEVMIILRACQGVGSALVFANSIALVSDVYQPAQRGRALGLTVAATYLGLSLGPTLGGMLVNTLGWRSVFILPLIIGFGSALACLKSLRHWKSVQLKPVSQTDWLGAGLSIAMPVLFVGGISQIGRTPLTGGILLGAGCLTLLAFVFVERARPGWRLVNIGLFSKNRLFTFSCLAALLNYSASYASGFLLSLWLQYTQKLAPHEAGLILVIQPAIQALLSPLFGHFSDRFDKGLLASLGMGLTACAIFWFACFTGKNDLTSIMIGLSLAGAGFALFSSPNSNAIMSAVRPKDYGAASSILALSRTSGQLLSMGLVIAGFALSFGQARLADQDPGLIADNISFLFLLMGFLILPGIAFSLARGKNQIKSP